VRGIAGDVSTTTLIILIAALSILIGLLIGAIVYIGDLERMPILRALDSLPGVVATTLTALCGFALFHLVRELLPLSSAATAGFAFLAAIVAILNGLKVHRHRLNIGLNTSSSRALTKIGSRRPNS
jgi:CBS domain containing-hemolysin-like protein